jgi:hypothetical protein
MSDEHPSTLHSLLMSSAVQRLAGALALVGLLWLAVAWALVEPG